MKIEIFGVGDARMDEALRVRFAVFVDEQRVPAEIEIDEHDRTDADAVHALVRDASGAVVAAGRYYLRDAETVQIGRMAVARSARGAGAGRALLDALMAEARRRGFRAATLDAQDHALGFYEKAGYVAAGETHYDAGILHQPMRRAL
ncbi:MAG: GNAT family N-acetyltransferase [Candidatus Velthaea sp.]